LLRLWNATLASHYSAIGSRSRTSGSHNRERMRIEDRAQVTPVGQVRVHELMEPNGMTSLREMHQLVHKHVLDALHRHPRKIEVEADSPGLLVAGSPSAGHRLNRPLRNTDADHRLPRVDQWRYELPEFGAIPVL